MMKMKTVFLTAMVVMSMATFGWAATLENVAVWAFDDDLVEPTHGYDGISYGATFSTDTPNPAGGVGYDYAGNRSLYFDGSDYARVVSSPISTQNLAFAGDLTVAMWVKTSSTAADQRIFYFSNDAGAPAGVSFNYQVNMASGKMTFWTRNVPNLGTPNVGTWSHVDTTSTYNDGNWHYIVCTNDGSTSNIYVDGALAVSGAALAPTPYVGTLYPLDFGKQSAGSPSFTGYLDEVQIVKGLADADMVAEMYNNSVVVPEPATMGLLLSGAVAMFLRKRNR